MLLSWVSHRRSKCPLGARPRARARCSHPPLDRAAPPAPLPRPRPCPLYQAASSRTPTQRGEAGADGVASRAGKWTSNTRKGGTAAAEAALAVLESIGAATLKKGHKKA
jgi:hypothetical protein